MSNGRTVSGHRKRVHDSRNIHPQFFLLPSPFPFTPVTARQSAAVVFWAYLGSSAIQRSCFARVNALCNFSRKKARKSRCYHFRAGL